MSDTTSKNPIPILTTAVAPPSEDPEDPTVVTTTSSSLTHTKYDSFLQHHRTQLLDVLQIPEPLIESLYQQLQNTFLPVVPVASVNTDHVPSNDPDENDNTSGSHSVLLAPASPVSPPSPTSPYDVLHASQSFQQQLLTYSSHYHHRRSFEIVQTFGTILVLPHLVTWDMCQANHFIQALLQTDTLVLQYIYDGLQQQLPSQRLPTESQHNADQSISTDPNKNKINLVNAIADHPMVWSRIVLYRSLSSSTATICGALLPPPYLPHAPLDHRRPTQTSGNDETIDEADGTGPFTFQYQWDAMDHRPIMDVSLLYVSPEGVHKMITTTSNPIIMDQHNDHTTSTSTSTSTESYLYLPTIDLVPQYQYPNPHQQTIRMARYVVLELLPNMTTGTANSTSSSAVSSKHPMIVHVKEIYTNFIHQMHMIRQQQQQQEQPQMTEPQNQMNGDYNINNNSDEDTNHPNHAHVHNTDETNTNSRIVYRVYTDSDDPMGLHHPVVGLEHNSPHFCMVTNIDEADIVFSYQSIFSPQYVHYEYVQERIRQSNSRSRSSTIGDPSTLRINQFPYEGAFVQKDHLARGILQQYGLPRPSWSIETYDLDVHFTEFVGSVVFAIEDEINKDDRTPSQSTTTTTSAPTVINPMNVAPLWIMKPASGTQSQGHIVTRNVAQMLRINDAVGGCRVAQRYIERPVCINQRKVDCRVIVLMTSAGSIDENGNILQLPTLFMHNICYFRIANKAHSIVTPIDRNDHESVLTASHLLHGNQRTTNDVLKTLPQHKDTIQQLEKEYPNAFDWENKILPQIQIMICELFNGMTKAYPKMIETKHSCAVYGVDVMFQVDDNDDIDQNDGEVYSNILITPKLTEVTFCPANNAICDAYTRDDELYRTYNKDIFECLFVGIVSKNITRLQ